MAESRDDFEWIVRALKGMGEGPRRGSGGRSGYETVDQIFERRQRKRARGAVILRLAIEIIPIVLMIIFLMLS